jgi:cobalt-zinc-cadmium resistance protein CzcA
MNIGSEFLPHLNEGALWVRASMPGNISLQEAERLFDGYEERGKHVLGVREFLRGFPEVTTFTAVTRPLTGVPITASLRSSKLTRESNGRSTVALGRPAGSTRT